MIKTLLAALAVGILSGCASSGRIGELPTIAADAPSSQLVLIRVSSIIGATNSYYVALDGKDIFSIRSGEYTRFRIPAGEHFIAVKCFGGWSPAWKEISKGFVAVADQTSYFEISPNMTCAEIRQITTDAGKAEVKNITFVDPETPSNRH
jgi:hypothetical protein